MQDVSLSLLKVSFPCPATPTASPPLISINQLHDNKPLLSIPCGTTKPPKQWISSFDAMKITLQTFGSALEFPDMNFGFHSRTPHYKCNYPDSAPSGLYRHSSFVLNDGSYYNYKMSENLDCKWIIAPLNSVGVTLGFTDLDVRGGGIEILENSTRKVVWKCTGCSIPPEKIQVEGAALVKLWTGADVSDEYEFGKGFSMYYHAIENAHTFGLGSKHEYLSSPSDPFLQVRNYILSGGRIDRFLCCVLGRSKKLTASSHS